MSKIIWAGVAIAAVAVPALAQPATTRRQQTGSYREIATLRQSLRAANARLDAQERRLRQLEARLSDTATTVAASSPASTALATRNLETRTLDPLSPDAVAPRPGTAVADASPTPPVLERVGEVPVSFDNMPNLTVLGDNGSVITRPGQLTTELGLEYARADRSRALFRGIEVVESVLVGTFDINESRQDVLTASASARYGVSSRFELGVRVPFVRRSDTSILAPVMGSTTSPSATIDSSARGTGLGDLELSARYQITPARTGRPFLIGNLQAIAPTGSNPFDVPRDADGRALKAATGAGFWGVSPSVTAILPSDPAVLFGTFGYTRNFGKDVDTFISPVRITQVKPGDSIAVSAGIGVTLNQRTSFNLGYAHTWAFGTKTTTLTDNPTSGNGITRQTARDLQIGRLLFGVTYRLNDRSSINWSVEAGTTDDATDLRTVLRLPIVLFSGH